MERRGASGDLVTDLAGNALAEPFAWEFQVVDAAFWISQVNGNWEQGFNWESGSPPAA